MNNILSYMANFLWNFIVPWPYFRKLAAFWEKRAFTPSWGGLKPAGVVCWTILGGFYEDENLGDYGRSTGDRRLCVAEKGAVLSGYVALCFGGILSGCYRDEKR
jgi:hypothetical protein